MKYIFCGIALLIQPIFAWYVYHRQDKTKAALKMPMIYFSGVYLVAQFTVFWKICRKIPSDYQNYAYLIQGALLVAFILLQLVLFGSNKYIENVEAKEQESIREFKQLIENMEICNVLIHDPGKKKCVEDLLEKMRYADPVSSEGVTQENEKIGKLIDELSDEMEMDLFQNKCSEIQKQLEIREIKNIRRK